MLALPGVVRADPTTYVGMMATGPSGHVTGGVNGLAVDWSAIDPTNRILEGTVPDGSDPSEVIVNEAFVKQYGISVGDTVHTRMFGLEQNDDVSRGVYRPTGPRYAFRVAGIERSAQDIALDEVHSVGGSAHGTHSAVERGDDGSNEAEHPDRHTLRCAAGG